MDESYPPPPEPIPAASAYPAGGRLIFGHALNNALEAYFAQWLNWLLPVCLSIFLGLVTMCGICLPLVIFGPLACGLFGCAFAALDGRQVNFASLRRGWRHFITASFAGLLLIMLTFVPLVIILCLQLLIMVLTVGFDALAAAGPNPQPGAESFGVLLLLPVQFLGLMFHMLWVVWIGTRTMFVLPTIVDRGYPLSAALDVSWEATRSRFWEFMFLNTVAVILGMVGMYLCYVGFILTAPLYFLAIAAAYDARIGRARP